MEHINVAVLMTAHNRREKTLSCLDSLRLTLPAQWPTAIYLVDDGSTDGTGTQIRQDHPEVIVIDGPGDLYWAAGMALAESRAASGNWDVVVWLNDDVELLPGRIEPIIRKALSDSGICTGAMRSKSGKTTYTGLRRVGRSPTRLRPVEPDAVDYRAIDTFHGNLVAVSRKAWESVGLIDSRYHHAYADTDYGLRASSRKLPVTLAPGHAGICEGDAEARAWRDPGLPTLSRIKLLFDVKGLPIRSQARYVRRFGGAFWGVHLMLSYARPLLTILRGRLGRRSRTD